MVKCSCGRDRAVPGYWTVDWDKSDPLIIIRDFALQPQQYVERVYRPGDTVESKVLPGFKLTVDESSIIKGTVSKQWSWPPTLLQANANPDN